MKLKEKNYLNKARGITLVALIITIIILLILAGVSVNVIMKDNGIVERAEDSNEENRKQTAKEIMNLKITNIQIKSYTEKEKMPTLQDLADKLCEDEEMEYVLLESKEVASLDKIEVGEGKSIFTKLKEYPYEFEINDSLQLASIDGVKIANSENEINKNDILASLENFEKIYQSNDTRGTYEYKLEKDYPFIIIIVYGIGYNGGSEDAVANINNNDVIKLIDNSKNVYSSAKYATKVTVGYIVNAKADTVINTNLGYYGKTYIFALGDEKEK